MTTLIGLLIFLTLPMQVGVTLMKRVKIGIRMTSSKILKMISSQWNKLGNQ